MGSFDQWIDRQYRYSASAMLQSISRSDLVKERPGFGTTVRPARGSVIASPVLASYDPDPDYCFHWYRDSAVVIESLRLLYEDGSLAPDAALRILADFVAFNRDLEALDGRALAGSNAWRTRVTEDFHKFLRDDAELAAVSGAEAVAAETRVNPDGTLDISKWARPQHDGPPLRALCLLRWLATGAAIDDATQEGMAHLVRADLGFAQRRWMQASYDIWEEDLGCHYYTLRVSAAALEEGAAWLRGQDGQAEALACEQQVQAIRARLDTLWSADAGHFRSRVLASGEPSTKELDIAVILSAIHADAPDEAHGLRDPRLHATLDGLDALFDRLYPINREREPARGPAMGRYAGDVYYSGGAYYFSSLGAAEFCFRAAAAGARDTARWIARGDAYLATVRAFTPASGELSEQFDQATGEQTSARHLAWSYAAFISCTAARRAALQGYAA